MFSKRTVPLCSPREYKRRQFEGGDGQAGNTNSGASGNGAGSAKPNTETDRAGLRVCSFFDVMECHIQPMLYSIMPKTDKEETMGRRKKKIDKEWTLNQAAEIYNRCMQAVPVKKKNGEDGTGEYTFNTKGALDALEFIDSILKEDGEATVSAEGVTIIDDIGGGKNG